MGETYMYFFFFDKLRKFTISDFPKQTHLGVHIDHFIKSPEIYHPGDFIFSYTH